MIRIRRRYERGIGTWPECHIVCDHARCTVEFGARPVSVELLAHMFGLARNVGWVSRSKNLRKWYDYCPKHAGVH